MIAEAALVKKVLIVLIVIACALALMYSRYALIETRETLPDSARQVSQG